VPCLLFDGVDDAMYYTVSGTGGGLKDVGKSAMTFAVLYKRVGAPSFCSHFHLTDNLANWATMNIAYEQQSNTTHTPQMSDGTNRNISQTVANATNSLVVISKPTGTATMSAQVKTIGGSWSSVATVASVPVSSGSNNATKLLIGAWALNNATSFIDYFPGRIGMVAFWNSDMTQAQREECGTNERTSDLYNHSIGHPVSLIEITSTSSVTDLGTAGVTGIGATFGGGPTADSDNLGWNFNGVGASTAGAAPAGMFDPDLNSLAWF
jgi:hypothetical protein